MPPRVIIGLSEWNVGGPCVFAERLARELTRLGWDVRILITELNTTRVGVRFVPRPMPDDIAFDTLPLGKDDSWGVRWGGLIRYLEERAPCIYVINCDWRNSVVASRLSDRVRLIGLIHADYELEYSQIERLGHYFNAIVAVSAPIQFNASHKFALLAPRMVTISNAVPTLAQIPTKETTGPLRICYCGELRYAQKRLDDLIRVAHGLDARKVSFELTFLGDGAMRADLEQQAQPLLDQGKVRFLGRLPGEQLLEELKRYHVVALTSEFEGLSIALLEAMSRGCIPVVTDLATQSLVTQNGVNSFCVPIGDIDAFVERLATLATDPEKRKQMAEAAFRTIVEGGYRVEDMLQSYIALFARVEASAESGNFVRNRGWLVPPPAYVGDMGILPITHPDWEAGLVNNYPMWPNAAPPVPAAGRTAHVSMSGDVSRCLKDYKVIVAIPSGQISGVDVFACHLIRRLRQQGIDAKIMGVKVAQHSLGMELPDDIPLDAYPYRASASWLVRWDAMIDYLEAQAPCIYIPNYDYDHSGICSRLSDRVKVINIAHSDDPAHYEHAVRLGRVSNAVVGVSKAIIHHLAGLDPTLTSRLRHIPYGVELPPPTARQYDPKAPLRIIYIGRLVTYQKRCLDLIDIARGLEARNIPFELTIVGDGPEREKLYTTGKDLILKRRLWFPGKLNNEEVMTLLQQNDVFLLPSAFEGLSVSLLEAMANGVVPLVSNIRSGVPEVIRSGENGLIAPVGDIECFVDHLVSLYAHPQERERMAQAAYDTICSGGYRLEDMIERYIDLFQDVITQPFARPQGPILPPDHLLPQLAWNVQMPYYLRKSIRATPLFRLLKRIKTKLVSR